ncbi:DEAD/DEAH box helicase [Lentilactobacillus hilgardii]|uniref:DEAD/DEAH box helicase family protein n=1 Tax=Lentilactobacillus hilgardii TaxID=1588 RepID=A0A6P1EBF7_LENHI|nr:DEAD/DEAH box helicase family protein [Lentilactobacillus hilgardii]EEI71664.1 type III restriction enzyme, res subunit [Lentilactobacillus hilgardii ATCC 27305]MCT3392881.1 restriction endonuclease [Lentilactobacillus hilgardii]QHB51444.1 DEAD/DEAH box helicase family protein [Lentilactobacillus hilgardii]RRG08898.1 MAG: restriction endonuclease [Lactobacillus sp.]
MELKEYQKGVLDDISRFLEEWSGPSDYNASTAYSHFWQIKGLKVADDGPINPYNDQIDNEKVPQLCVKIPTGGGKTFVAASALKLLSDYLPYTDKKAVVWLVPSDSILKQTFKALSDPTHPYRKRIDADFSHRVEIYGKDELLGGQNFTNSSIEHQLSIFVLSFNSLRTSNKDSRLVYQENGNLLSFKSSLTNQNVLDDADELSLIQVIRSLDPIVIVDESHHATSKLSIDMLKNINPTFILELTATPRQSSNVLSFVDSYSLKKEHMVKLPVIVYNRNDKSEVIGTAIAIRNKLESLANKIKKKRYIRPIVLFQAEPQNKDGAVTFNRIKKDLIKVGIPSEQIAIKTANVDDIGDTDLMNPECPIRYIITVNALKEGWDCPFAYILATIANKSSKVDVEQILGRVLRLPYASESSEELLNLSYVLTSSDDFANALDGIVKGLNQAGFSPEDYRAIDNISQYPSIDSPVPFKNDTNSTPFQTKSVSKELQIEEINSDTVKAWLPHNPNKEVNRETKTDRLLNQAKKMNTVYKKETYNRLNQSSDGFVPYDLSKRVPKITIQPQYIEDASNTVLPQFTIPGEKTIFSDTSSRLLTFSDLTINFDLSKSDLNINLTETLPEMAKIDVNSQNKVKQGRITGNFSGIEKIIYDKAPLRQAIEIAIHRADSINFVDHRSVCSYVNRVVNSLSASQKETIIKKPLFFAEKVKAKIFDLINKEEQKEFNERLEIDSISVEPTYHFPNEMLLTNSIDSLEKTLYSAEQRGNGFERKMMDMLSESKNILWWHRNPARSKYGFCMNGPFNHWPDFIAKTLTGKVLIIETKGDDLRDNGIERARLGSQWQSLAGIHDFRYFLVFQHLQEKETVNFTKFKDILSKL